MNLPPIHIDLSLAFGILCGGVALAVTLRLLEAYASRVAVVRTERILNEHMRSGEP